MSTRPLHTQLPLIAAVRPGRVCVVAAILAALVAAAAIPSQALFEDRAVASLSLLVVLGLVWAGLCVWLLPLLVGMQRHLAPSLRQAAARLALVTVVFASLSTAPAMAWWVHVANVDARTADDVELALLCEPYRVLQSEGAGVALWTFTGGWVSWRYRPYERGVAYGIPREGVCPPWDGELRWTHRAEYEFRWMLREDARDEAFVYTAALQRRGLVEASSIANVSTLVSLCAAAGAAFALLACSLWFPLRRPSRAMPRFGIYAWLANLVLIALTLRAMLWLPGVYPAPDDGPSAIAAIALAAFYVVLLPSIVRRKRYHITIALTWPLTIVLVLAIPFWVAAAVQGGWFGVDPDVWRLPALASLVAAFALTPLVAAVNERIRAMPD